jgi:hypothetical protein
MSPEQAEGEIAGPPSDIYSLALTAYECWSGSNPVAGRTPAETARRIGEPVAPLRLTRPDLPEGLTDTIDACLDPDPELRPTPFELRDCVLAEMPELDEVHALPGTSTQADDREPREPIATARLAVLAACITALAVIAGPLAAPGLAIVLALLATPMLVVGATVPSLAVLAAPLLGAIGLGPAAAGLGAVGPTPPARAILGAGAWFCLFGGALALGIGPLMGVAPAAPAGWISDASLTAEAVLKPLFGFDSVLGACVFAIAAVALGRLLEMRHASLALLAAMLWAAAVNAAISPVGDGSRAGRPFALVPTAALAVALEFAVLRPRGQDPAPTAAPAPPPHAPRGRFAGRLA